MARVYVWLCAAFVGIGGIMFGYEVSSTNGIKEMSGYRHTFNISYSLSEHLINQSAAPCVSVDDVETSALLGAIVSVFSIGALVGALLSGLLSDLAGRKVTVIIGASLYALGGTLQTSSFFLWMLFPARIISGIGTGITLQACPLYIAEMAPKERRGILVSMVNAVGATGLVAGIVINTITERYIFGWRVSLSVQILVGSVLALGVIFLHETPRFLVKKNKDVKALKVLVKIHGDHTRAQSELTEIQLSIRGPTDQKNCSQILKYFCSVSIVQRVLIGFVLMLMTRITGPPVIAYYSVSIFCKVGVDGFIGTVILVVVMFIAQIIGVLIIDKSGRKLLLLLGTMAMGVLLVAAAALIQLFDLEEGTNLSTAQKIAGYFVIIVICLLMASYVLSLGTCSWIVISEIYPLRVRGIGAALGQLGWWSGTIFMGEIGPILLSSPLRTSGTFYLFAGMCFLAFLHALLLIPETKRQSLESIEHLFAQPWSKRVDVFYYLRCGCFCCTRRTGMELVPTDVVADFEEREQLQEPLDQISLNSVDSAELDVSTVSDNGLKSTETLV